MARQRPMSVVRKTPAQVVALINELLETANNRQIAARHLNLGIATGAANPSR